MKLFIIAPILLLIPAVAFAYDYKWSNYYEGVAGGSAKSLDQVKTLAVQRAHDAAVVGGCSRDFYGDTHSPSLQIGQIELPTTCQCVDDVCICTDKLEIVCFNKGK